MAEMVCPYDKVTLQLALLGIEKKMDKEDLAKRVESRMSEFLVTDKAELNKKLAEHNGIEVIDLINSPNYETLKEEYSKSLMMKALDILKEESFSDKEAWALLVFGSGMLKL